MKSYSKTIIQLVLCQFIGMVLSLHSQTSNISGIINTYTPVTALGSCLNQVTVSSAAGLSAGNIVLIIQMQGATINETNTASFGTISSYNNSGFFEKAVILTISGNDIYFTNNLVNSYSPASGKVQIISVPQYVDVNVNGVLNCQDWNGTTGGVLAFDASGSVTLNASINVSGRGFRGGADIQICPNGCNFVTNENLYYYPIGNYRGGTKGEGIANYISLKELGRGSQANGGGGGNDHNNGGAGGGNYAIGGRGGNNAEPGAFNCKGNSNYGVAGNSLNFGASPNRLFIGGGGGAGHGNNGTTGGCSNNGNAGPGGDGGGIVLVSCSVFNGNGQLINASGLDGGSASGDGGGGGGAGGVVCMRINSAFGISPFTVNVRGGIGGNANANLGNRCYGPGGGGGGGAVFCNIALPGSTITQLNGGNPGIVISSTNACNNTSTTALAGSSGTIINSLSVPQGSVSAGGACNPLPVSLISFDGYYHNNANELFWTTSSETNNEGFAIERSSDCIEFEERGFESGHGNSNLENNYVFIDFFPMEGINYYRLKQIDYNGDFSHSPTISISNEHSSEVYIFPNPGTGQFNIGGLQIDNARLEISNSMGQCVYSRSIATSQFDISHLGKGVYHLVLTTKRLTFRKKIIIQ